MIRHGDALDELKKLDNDSIDLLCTDPPYGYGFMGKNWDKAVPSVDVWRECLRVLKPGAFCFVMSAPRSDVQAQMIVRLTEAGFRLDFTPIYWTYASGFPKAGNIGKLIDKRLGAEREVIGERIQHDIRNNSYATKKTNFVEQIKGSAVSEEAKALDGSYAGFQPKPAVEVIIVAMKPLSEKTYVEQALANGHGISWLDDARIPTGDEDLSKLKAFGDMPENKTDGVGFSRPWMADKENIRQKQEAAIENMKNKGRFPANLLVSDDVLNDGTVSKSKDGGKSGTNADPYSRYFDLDKWAQTLPFLIVPKASKREKNEGLEAWQDKPTTDYSGNFIQESGSERWTIDSRHPDGGYYQVRKTTKNNHPTVKPLKLMSYLITLGSRPSDVVLDPFVGSGTTCLAARNLDRQYIGIERELEYVDIANARLADKEQGRLV